MVRSNFTYLLTQWISYINLPDWVGERIDLLLQAIKIPNDFELEVVGLPVPKLSSQVIVNDYQCSNA